ncbi:MAG: hypothetical protein ACTSRU_16150 [Candidatus Hodarchaeales archaeon]
MFKISSYFRIFTNEQYEQAHLGTLGFVSDQNGVIETKAYPYIS